MNPMLARLGRRYAAWRVSRDLDGLHVAGVDTLRAALDRGPVLVVANHVAWWDGLVALGLGHQLGAEVALVARADSLVRSPWMRPLGVFPLHPGLGLRASLRSAGGFLDRPGRMLWFFPQGRQRPDSVRPLGFQPGLRTLAQTVGAPILPISLAYPFREVEVPAAAMSVGTPTTRPDVAELEGSVIDGLRRIERWADQAADEGFVPVIDSRRAPQQAGVAARLLGSVLA